MNYSKNIARLFEKAVYDSGLSQRELADALGVSRSSLQNWLDGVSAPELGELLTFLPKIQNVTVFPLLLEVCHPDLFAAQTTDEKRKALLTFYRDIATPRFIAQEHYLLMSEHGSNFEGIKQMDIAHIQSRLADRRRNCMAALTGYQDAVAMGAVTDPQAPQPDIETLEICIARSTQSVKAGLNAYTIAGDVADAFYIRAAAMWQRLIDQSGLSQRELSKALGVSAPTLRNWATGKSRPKLDTELQALEYFPGSSFSTLQEMVFPQLYTGHPDDAAKRREVLAYYSAAATDSLIEIEYFRIFGDHGSSHIGLENMSIAHVQSKLADRRRNCWNSLTGYQEAKYLGQLTDPDGPQPDMDYLIACYNASTESVRHGLSSYNLDSAAGAKEAQ